MIERTNVIVMAIMARLHPIRNPGYALRDEPTYSWYVPPIKPSVLVAIQ